MFIVAIIIALLGLVALIFGATQKQSGALLGGVGALVLGLLVGIWSMSYSQDPGEAKVIKSFTGQVSPEADTTEGLGWHGPLDSLIDYDIRNKQAAFSKPENTRVPAEELLGGELTFSDKDKVTGQMDIFVNYSILPQSVVGIYREYGTQVEFEAKVISPQVKSTIKSVPGAFTTSEMLNDRAKISSAIEKAFKDRWESKGIIVESVDIQDVRYPENVRNAFSDAQNARTKIQTEEANLKAAEVSAQQKVVQAKADAESNRLLNASLTPSVIKNREIDAFRFAAEKGNMIISDGSVIANIPGSTK